MKREHRDLKARRSVITGMSAAAAGLTLGATMARAQTTQATRSGFQPVRHLEDAWMDALRGDHRAFIDSASPNGGAEAVLYANNIYRAHASGYSGEPQDFAMVVCFRHASTPFGYGDAVWEKYGQLIDEIIEFQDPITGRWPTRNLMNSRDHTMLPNRGVTLESLVARGAHFAICNSATQFVASQLAASTGAKTEDVYAELVASAIPNSHFVPAGVIAVTRAQEYGYSLLSAG